MPDEYITALPELERDRRDWMEAMWDVLDENVSLAEMREWRALGIRIGHC